MQLKPAGTLASNAAWIFLGQGLGYSLRVVYFIAVARLLGVLQYGFVVGAFAFVNLLAEQSRLGTGTILLRYVSPDHKRFAKYWGNTLVVTLVSSGLVILLLGLIAPHLLDPGSAALVFLTAIACCFFEQLSVSATQVFQAFQKMRTAAFLNQLTSLLRCIGAIGMLLRWHHATAVQWAFLSVLVSAMSAAIAITVVTYRIGKPNFQLRLVLKHGVEGAEYAFASSTTSAYNDLDKTILSHLGLNAADGIYGMAYRIIEMAAVPVASIQLAATPRLFQMAEAGASGPITLGMKLLKRGMALSLAVSITLFFIAPIMPRLVGAGFSESVSALRWLCLIPFFRSVHGISGSVLTAVGLQRRRTMTQIAAVLLNLGLNLWLIPSHGWLGAAWSSLATDGMLGILNWSSLEAERRRMLGTLIGNPRVDTAQPSCHMPLVSVIIPYYNQPAYLAEAVESVLVQTHRNFEIIIVDDGSTIHAETLVSQSSAIRIFRTENKGVSAARNYGFENSSADYVIFLDSDDRLLPDAVEKHLGVFQRYPEVALAFGPVRIIDGSGQVISPAHVCRPRDNYFLMLLGSNPIPCPGAAMIRRDPFINVGMFDVSYRNADDYHLYLRLSRTYLFRRHDSCVVEYRKHGAGKSQNKVKMISSVMAALDHMEGQYELAPKEVRALRNGRARWIHTYKAKHDLRYFFWQLYYGFKAMLTVSIRHYF